MLSYLIEHGVCKDIISAMDYVDNGIIRWLGNMSDKPPVIVTVL